MITDESPKREIRDLQRLLITLGHLDWTIDATGGKWGKETQAAVVAAYAALGWEHPDDGKWVSAAALAAMAARLPPVGAAGGAGSYAGGAGSYAGGAGSYAGGAGSYAGGAGSYAGGGSAPDEVPAEDDPEPDD